MDESRDWLRARLSVGPATMHGTGFRVGPDCILTNWHVLHNDAEVRATAVVAVFGDEEAGSPVRVTCDPATIAACEADDWGAIRAAGLRDDWPAFDLAAAADPVPGEAAYIIQHPGGLPKRLGFVRNQVTSFDDRVVHYLTDTQAGSSGAPVLDAAGRLIALHRAGGRPQEIVGRAPVKKNEGVRVPRVAAGLAALGVDVTRPSSPASESAG